MKMNVGVRTCLSLLENITLNDKNYGFQQKINFEVELFQTFSFGKNQKFYE